jgi:hypothetical protein
MAKKVKYISREEIEASEKKLKDMMMQNPQGREQLKEIEKLEKKFIEKGRRAKKLE